MRAIVGLGNPGARYRYNRHNVGWRVLDCLAARWRSGRGVSQEGKLERARHAEIARFRVDGDAVLLVKPLTFMNDSGWAVRALLEKDHLAPEEMLVIYDDLDLALGRVRIRAQGSSGGHGGIKSIQQHLAELARIRSERAAVKPELAAGEGSGVAARLVDGPPALPSFPRLKVGVGRPPPGVDPVDFVLGDFLPEELPLIEPAVEQAADAAECWLREGTAAAMNRFNGK